MRLVLTLLSILTFTGSLLAENTYALIENLPYVEASVDEYQRQQCKLDIYYPTSKKDFATIIFFHPGGLKSGKRFIPKELKSQGVAVVAAGYRLHPRVKSPAYLQDAAAAVAWCLKSIKDYGGDAARIYVSGHSAGGYLTSMIGLDPKWLAAHGCKPEQLAGLFALSGQCITHSTVRLERGIRNHQPVIDEMAPLFHVRKNAPPLLLFTGGRDLEMRGRYEENAYLWRMMRHVGHKQTKLYEFEGYGHGNMPKPAYPLILDFIRKNKRK